MLCKRLHLANYDIIRPISPLQIRNTGYAEVPLLVYGQKHEVIYIFQNY